MARVDANSTCYANNIHRKDWYGGKMLCSRLDDKHQTEPINCAGYSFGELQISYRARPLGMRPHLE